MPTTHHLALSEELTMHHALEQKGLLRKALVLVLTDEAEVDLSQLGTIIQLAANDGEAGAPS